MAPPSKPRRPRAERETVVLDTAARLFYARGVHEVGMDALIAEVGLGKATVYRLYPTKNELISAYLGRLRDDILRAIDADIADSESASDAVLRILEAIEADVRRPEFRGCPFDNADHPARTASRDYRRDLADRFVALAGDRRGRQIAVLVDGVYTSAAHLEPDGPAREGLALARELATAD